MLFNFIMNSLLTIKCGFKHYKHKHGYDHLNHTKNMLDCVPIHLTFDLINSKR